jgi:hypothetical protein
MLVRAIALSLALLVGIGVIVPLATDNAEAGPRAKKKNRKQAKKYKKYSRAWWRQYNARQKKKRAVARSKRNLRLRQMRVAAQQQNDGVVQNTRATAAPQRRTNAAPAVLPSGAPAPNGWTPAQASPAELQFRVDASSGEQVGSASISVVGPAIGETSTGARKAIGGVSTTSLRREIIDRMIRENGWVVNDYQKEIGGQQVYVVEAQSQAKNGRVQSRLFYFTEVDGRIYNVATNSAADQTERLAEESEKVINSLKTRVRPVLRASNQ